MSKRSKGEARETDKLGDVLTEMIKHGYKPEPGQETEIELLALSMIAAANDPKGKNFQYAMNQIIKLTGIGEEFHW